MPRGYELSAEAQNDLFEIWRHIAEDSHQLANRIEDEFHALFDSLGHMPWQGHKRKDVTAWSVLFMPLYPVLVCSSQMPSQFGLSRCCGGGGM